MSYNVKNYIVLHAVLLLYTFIGIVSKLVSNEEILSLKFFLCYSLVILLLGIYAIVWQQVLKRMSLITAYSNKAITVVWGLVLGNIFFGEGITLNKIIGSFTIIIGVILVAKSEGEEKTSE